MMAVSSPVSASVTTMDAGTVLLPSAALRGRKLYIERHKRDEIARFEDRSRELDIDKRSRNNALERQQELQRERGRDRTL